MDAADGRGTHIKELELAVNESVSWNVYCDGTEPLKVTIAWSDPPGNPSATTSIDDPTPMLVNNLDLLVQPVAQTQTVHRPWILNPDLSNKTVAARSAAAITGYDDRNNVEQVFVENPSAGEYRITVAHSGGLPDGEIPSAQWVSVISSGDIPLAPKFTGIENVPQSQYGAWFESDPAAYLEVEYTIDLNEPQVWDSLGVLITEPSPNLLLPDVSASNAFFRLKRVTP